MHLLVEGFDYGLSNLCRKEKSKEEALDETISATGGIWTQTFQFSATA